MTPSYWKVGVFDWSRNGLSRDSAKATPQGRYHKSLIEFVRAEGIFLWNVDYGFPELSKYIAQIRSIREAEAGQRVDRQNAGAGGRPPSTDWEAVVIEAAAHVYRLGSSIKQKELISYIIRWLQSQRKSVPDESALRKHLKPLLDRFKNEDADRSS